MTSHPFAPPLDQLLGLGEPREAPDWRDYVALGLRPEHLSDLIRMATDPALNEAASDSAEVWAPLHAWRALAQLGAVEAVGPLTTLFRRIDEQNDDWVAEDLPEAIGRLGPGAIPALSAYPADDVNGEWARVAAAHSLARIASRHPQAREACVAALARQLEHAAQQPPSLNGTFVALLLDLKAMEAAPVIERAFRARRVDELAAGDWEDVQVALGLKARREQPHRPPPPGSPWAVLHQLDQALRQRYPPPASEVGSVAPGESPVAPPGSKRKRKRHRKRSS